VDGTPVDAGKNRLSEKTGFEHPGPALLVADDGGSHDQPVAPGVITVLMSVDQGADRMGGDGFDGAQQGTGPALGETGVDQGDAVARDQEGGVVEAPLAVELEVGKHAVGYFLHLGSGRGHVKMRMAHRLIFPNHSATGGRPSMSMSSRRWRAQSSRLSWKWSCRVGRPLRSSSELPVSW